MKRLDLNSITMSSKLERQKLTLPVGHDKLLLRSCCAPCSGEVMETLIESDIDFSIFFYNPNIHPVKEYLIRKEENIRFAEKHNIPFIDCEPYRVCRRVNILRDYPYDKIKIHP